MSSSSSFNHNSCCHHHGYGHGGYHHHSRGCHGCNYVCGSHYGSRCYRSQSYLYNTDTGSEEGWVGHPLDPVGCLFDVLADASLIVDDQTPRAATYFGKMIKLSLGNLSNQIPEKKFQLFFLF